MTAHGNDTGPPTGRRRMNRSRVIIATAATGSLVVGAALAAFMVAGPAGARLPAPTASRQGPPAPPIAVSSPALRAASG